MAEVRQLHLYLEGLVQGVGMRDYVRRQARALGLVGFVRNLLDGRVEVVAEGREEDLRALLTRLENPAVGRVDRIEKEYLPASGRFHNFDITY